MRGGQDRKRKKVALNHYDLSKKHKNTEGLKKNRVPADVTKS